MKVNLAPNVTKTQKDLDGSMKASNLIDLYTMLILQQMTLPPIQGVPNLPVHQQQTKATARSWRSVVRPALFRANDAIIVFGDYFNIFYGSLYSTAPQVLSNPESEKLFTALLEELKDEIRRQKTLTTDAAVKLRTFLNNMASHSSDLTLDVRQLDNSTSNTRGESDYIRQRIANLESRIMDIENDLKTTTETVTDTYFFFIQRSRVVSRDTSESRRILDSLINQRYEQYMRLVSLNSNIAMADIVKSEVTKLIQYVKNVLNATEALQKAWTQLETDYETVNDKLSKVNNKKALVIGIILQKQLEAGKKAWENLLNYAKSIKESHLAPPTLDVLSQGQF